jgi:hypothetical protein
MMNPKRFKAYNKFGWPLCPKCGEDRLFSFLMSLWNAERREPSLQEYLTNQFGCASCQWLEEESERKPAMKDPLCRGYGTPILDALSGRAKPKMKVVLYPKEADSVVLDLSIVPWTSAKELRYLCLLAKQVSGDILEIGCNEGLTTRELAIANKDRCVYGVDFTGPDDTMCQDQKFEKPTKEGIGKHAIGLANVKILDCKSCDVLPLISTAIGLVFIDADHTYAGTKTDSEVAMALIAKNPNGGIITWHDCMDGAASWVGVKAFLEKEIEPNYPVVSIEGTWIAMLDLRK